ncbi:YbcC family protein [uncultured Roseobacter sp.]|uniref:YbcC family protein n=1 Tax=uncultured Roseobacter sp. TaxID=114847 RepID=UPI002624A9EA|nr:DUF2309 domain-containing protein [uncultured Roseobacter sp.]
MRADTYTGYSGAHLELIAASETASRAIPPLWPLSSSVAVNPFLGQTDLSLSETSALLARISGTSLTMPRTWYADRIADGTISDGDLTAALQHAPSGAPNSIEVLKEMAQEAEEEIDALPTIADLAARASGVDWPALIDARIGAWAAGYFDAGQALWQVTAGRGAFESWQIFARRDLTPEITGLSGFAALVATTPDSARTALSHACDALGMSSQSAPTYFHQLLTSLGGWAQVARQRVWQAELDQKTDPITTDMLTIRLVWEQALYARFKPQIDAEWQATRAAHASTPEPTSAQIVNAVLQEAAEHAAQRRLARTLSSASTKGADNRPTLQAAFCIDVRSEVFRRALEATDPGVETLGFAGFFGLTAAHRGFASDVEELRLPVLLTPGISSSSSPSGKTSEEQSTRLSARAIRAWGRFKLAAVSSFAFVEAAGPIYIGKLLRDAFGLDGAPSPDTQAPHFADSFTLADKVTAAGTILRAMSLTEGFAPLVLIVGHGAHVVNNPHASALHCGACGGYSGEVNARLLAGLLNAQDVRDGLARNGIKIPSDTRFIGALHHTTTDDVTLYDADLDSDADRRLVTKAKELLASAGQHARTERAPRLPRSTTGDTIKTRAQDWSETRPEWALAGCSAFIAAPRCRTRGKAFEGRAFLHDYDWRKDEGFDVLELILTAPVVVASWISLQYYGSVVAPGLFGAGNKLLHNVTGGIGVVEGNGGVLRAGLPWQSVHDGKTFAHDPLRLSVCIEAPQEAVSDILDRHPDVRTLFDNRWLHLFLMDGSGQLARRYSGDLQWEDFQTDHTDIEANLAA